MRHRSFDHPERRVHVRLHRRVEIFGRNIKDGCACLLPSGVANENIESAQLLYCIRNELAAKIFVAKIAGHGDSFAAGFLNEPDDFVRIELFRWKIVNDYVSAFTRERDRRGAAHSRITSGNERSSA